MISFNTEYNIQNLQDAANCCGTPVSHLKFIETKELSLQDIFWMWTKNSVYAMEEENGLKFAI